MLSFDDNWRFSSPGSISYQIQDEFFTIVTKLAKSKQEVFERFKQTFGSVTGQSPARSSNMSWANSDLSNYMSEARINAPLFIEAMYDGWSSLSSEYPAVNTEIINRILSQNGSPYQIEGNTLISNSLPLIIASPEIPKSLLEKAKETIDTSIKEGDRLMLEGRYRPAVLETLWLLETIITVFDGMQIEGETIEGKYFNQIIEKLAQNNNGKTLKQVIDWVRKLHGYLSAPAGGGIRHGVHLAEGVVTTPNEAWLYYNLSKSYIAYFLGEYERLKEMGKPVDDLPF